MNKIKRELREAQVRILANMVFEYQGSDPKVQKKIGDIIREAQKNIASSKKSFITVEKIVDEILR